MTFAEREKDENDSASDYDHGGYGSIDIGDSNGLPPAGATTETYEKEPLTYTDMLKKNPTFRYFLMSYVINKMVSDISAEGGFDSNQSIISDVC